MGAKEELELIELLRWLLGGLGTHELSHFLYSGATPLPLNARATGIFVGLLLALALRARAGSWRTIAQPTGFFAGLLVSGLVLGVLDGLHGALNNPLYTPTPDSRYWSGALIGVCGGYLVAPLWQLARGSDCMESDLFDDLEGGLGALGFAFGGLFLLYSSLSLTPLLLAGVTLLGVLLAGSMGGLLLLGRGPGARLRPRPQLLLSVGVSVLGLLLSALLAAS